LARQGSASMDDRCADFESAGRRRWPTALADGALAMRSGAEDAASGSAVGWRGGAGRGGAGRGGAGSRLSRLSRLAMWRWAALADGSEVERVGEDRGEQELRDVRREPLAPLQRATCDARHAIFNMRSATCDLQHAICNMHREACNTRRAACSMQQYR
jgi:hypothetical protein